MPKLSVIVTVGSPVVYQSLDGENLLTAALSAAYAFCKETSLPNMLYVAASDIDAVREATKDLTFEFSEIKAEPNQLASAIKNLDFEMVAIHDAQRPLTRSAQFHRAPTITGVIAAGRVRVRAPNIHLFIMGVTYQAKRDLPYPKQCEESLRFGGLCEL